LNVNLAEVWRDKPLLEAIDSEVFRQKHAGWRPWEIMLPPDLLWPMLEEVSSGMVQQWSPVLRGVGVQVGIPSEVSIRFVRAGETQSPVMVKAMPYTPAKKDNIIPVEVHHGNKI
jgi:hypothetical protein